MKKELGRFIEGARATVPTFAIASVREKKPYYINFQKLDGQPTQNPLEVDGHVWMKGWFVSSFSPY